MNIAPADAVALEAYLSLSYRAERSSLGPMLERAEMFATERTARPEGQTMAVRTSHSYMGNEGPSEMMLAWLWAGKLLDAVGKTDKAAELALRTWFGDAGASWAHHREGRLGSLFALTRSGAELVARWRRKARGDRREMSVDAMLQQLPTFASIPDKHLHNAARIEAVHARVRAENAWNAVRSARGKRAKETV